MSLTNGPSQDLFVADGMATAKSLFIAVCQDWRMATLDDVARRQAADIDPHHAEPEYLALCSAEAAPLDGTFAVTHERLNGPFLAWA